MTYYCNPLNFSYKYQFNKREDGKLIASRESADPSMILYKGTYYIFPSMTCGFLYSTNMADWNYHPLKSIPSYDYAPDVRVLDNYIYFSASNHDEGIFYRTNDPFKDEFEKVSSIFPFWDPNLFIDDDNRIYLYWGSSTVEPLYAIELNSDMKPIGDKVHLISCHSDVNGYERSGENHIPERTQEEIELFLQQIEVAKAHMSESVIETATSYVLGKPYIEGVWVNKHNGVYYLQYASPSSRHNIYSDGVYVSKSPLGPFTLAENNPYSYKPGGFIPGAGHGSSMVDKYENLWHTATMRINKNHNFERRIGLWKSGWDNDGEMFCNQQYGDWPIKVSGGKDTPFEKPDWMLLSYGKKTNSSSNVNEKSSKNIVDENIQTWWRAESNQSNEWVEVDLENNYDVHAIQINFADDEFEPQNFDESLLNDALLQSRWIDETSQVTRWKLEGSLDGVNYYMIEDKSEVNTDLPHDLVVREDGIKVRFIRLTILELPYNQTPCISGLRVFGLGDGDFPTKAANITSKIDGDLDISISWDGDATGYVVLWGHSPEKLYHSYQVFNTNVNIGALIKGQETYIQIDSFNENGITEGNVIKVR